MKTTNDQVIHQLKKVLGNVIDAYNSPRYMGESDVRESYIRKKINEATNLLLKLDDEALEELTIIP